jgi:peptidoglycan hydrolase-like protein with peptidoglycan-binding domain
MVMYPTYSGLVQLDVIARAKNFTGMHPTMQERVRAMLEDSGGKLGWGQGVRTPQQQLQLFLERHTPDPQGTIIWNGQTYSKRPGVAAAVPPGRSMHEVGLAADLAGDFAWLGKNVGRFGLMTFADVNHEPWHVQPVELPKGRQQYEQQGSKWGAYPSYNMEFKKPDAAAQTQPAAPVTGSDAPSPAAAPTLTPALVARPGDAGPAARVLIEALIARSVLPDAAASRDGNYGTDDKELVLNYQRENGLVVDGEVGPQTWSKLLATVNPGDTSPMVKVLQTTLIVRALIRDAEANLDGVYGLATQQRVRDFQKVSGIDPIAIVGPETWTALLGAKRKVNVGTRGLPGEDDTATATAPGASPGAGVDVDLDDLDFLAALDGLPAE